MHLRRWSCHFWSDTLQRHYDNTTPQHTILQTWRRCKLDFEAFRRFQPFSQDWYCFPVKRQTEHGQAFTTLFVQQEIWSNCPHKSKMKQQQQCHGNKGTIEGFDFCWWTNSKDGSWKSSFTPDLQEVWKKPVNVFCDQTSSHSSYQAATGLPSPFKTNKTLWQPLSLTKKSPNEKSSWVLIFSTNRSRDESHVFNNKVRFLEFPINFLSER